MLLLLLLLLRNIHKCARSGFFGIKGVFVGSIWHSLGTIDNEEASREDGVAGLKTSRGGVEKRVWN
jgi:hypothetical protein